VPYGIGRFILIIFGIRLSLGKGVNVLGESGEPQVYFLIFSKRLNIREAIMINNSSVQKWDRLNKKQLDQQFVNEMIQGLQCSPFEGGAILDSVHKVFGAYFETSDTLKPGQTLFQVVSSQTPANVRLEDSKQVAVVLTVDAGDEDLQIRKDEGVPGLRRHRIQRVCEEAFQQDGLLTVEDLAVRLFNCGERTISRDLSYFKQHQIVLPLRSTIKDMGRAITHRTLIIEEWLKGKEYSQIARVTYHSIPSVKNYVNKFKRVVALANENFDVNTISFLVKMSPSLVAEYYSLYNRLEIVSSRAKELKSFLKEQNLSQNNASGESGND